MNANFCRVLALCGLCLWAVSAVHAQNDRDYIRRGNRLMEDSLFDKAQVQYQKAVEFDNTNPQAHYNLGNAFLMQNKAEDAMKEYETATKLERDKMRLSQIYHNMGVIFQGSKQFDKAVACYQQSLRNNPLSDETRYNYVLSLYQLKQGGSDDQQKDENGEDQKKQQDEQKQQEQEKQNKKNEQKQEQKQAPDPQQMSKENAEQMLKAAMQDEKATQEKLQKAQQPPQQKQLRKQW